MKIKRLYETDDKYYKILGYNASMLDYLSGSYQVWTEAEGLEQISADEQDIDKLTVEQNEYISAFIKLWDIASDFESEYYRDNFTAKLMARKYNI